MKIINLTPHEINILNNNGEEIVTISPSGTVSRCAVSKKLIKTDNGIEFYRSIFGEVNDLPEPQLDTIYIVSGLVRAAMPERNDLWQPGELVRDKSGRPIGCKGLSQ